MSASAAAGCCRCSSSASFLFPTTNRLVDSRRVLSSLANLAQTLHGELLVAPESRSGGRPDVDDRGDESGIVSPSGSTRLIATKLVILVGDRWDIQNLAIREGVRALVVTGGMQVETKTIDAAQKKKSA
jgi:hypothetical protein